MTGRAAFEVLRFLAIFPRKPSFVSTLSGLLTKILLPDRLGMSFEGPRARSGGRVLVAEAFVVRSWGREKASAGPLRGLFPRPNESWSRGQVDSEAYGLLGMACKPC